MKKCSLICIKPPICYILTTKNIFWFKNIPGCVNKINAFQASQTTQGLYWSWRVWDGFLVLRIYDLVILKLPQLDWIIKFISGARIFRFLPLLSHIFPSGSHQTLWQCMLPLAWVGSALDHLGWCVGHVTIVSLIIPDLIRPLKSTRQTSNIFSCLSSLLFWVSYPFPIQIWFWGDEGCCKLMGSSVN